MGRVSNRSYRQTLFFEPWDPYWNLFNIWTSEIAISGYVVTGLTLFSRFAWSVRSAASPAPAGAINGLTNSFSLLNIKREEKTCIHCDRCDQVCPVKIVRCRNRPPSTTLKVHPLPAMHRDLPE